MKTYVVEGPTPLKGDVTISGAKNATLKLMAAALMVPGEVILERVPRITDVYLMVEVLERLGAEVSFEGTTLRIDVTSEPADEATYELVSKMRASIQVLGPLLARLGPLGSRCRAATRSVLDRSISIFEGSSGWERSSPPSTGTLPASLRG